MSAQKTLAGSLVVAALLAAAGAGWFLLHARPPAPPAAGSTDAGGGGAESGATPVQSVPAPASTDSAASDDEEDDESDLERSPEGESIGATTEEILAFAAAGKWMDVERLLAISGSSDPRVTELILKTLSDLRWRYKAADLAKYLKDPAALARFLDLAKAEGDENTRSAALQACAILGGPGVAEAAIDILRDARPGSILANGAAGALGTLGTPEAARTLVEMLRNSLGNSRQTPVFLEALAKVQGAEALAELGRLAADEGCDAALRAAVISALGRTRNPAVVADLLKAAKDSGSMEVRHAALGALAMVGSPEGVAELLNIIQGGSNEDKVVAAAALQNVKNRAAGPMIEQALQGSLPGELKGHLVDALGKTGGKSAVSLLVKMAGDGDESMGLRGTAVRSLGEIGDASATGTVLDLLENAPRTEAPFRRECIRALGNLATREDVPRLEKILKTVTEQSSEWHTLRSVIGRLTSGRGEELVK